MTRTRLPDFIIGGAPRSGTTWMYHMLNRHPEIQMAEPLNPEPKFFMINEIYQRGLLFYSSKWFNGIPRKYLAGEKSTNYLERPQAAKRIKQCIPEVKLIFILRDPVDRAYSNWLWSTKNKLETEDFKTALALESERDKNVPEHLTYSRPHCYIGRGLYADLLEPYFKIFPRNQILCLLYDDLEKDPANVSKQTHEFLDALVRPEDGEGIGKVNSVSRKGLKIPTDCFKMLREQFTEPNKRLEEIIGVNLKAWMT